MVRVHWWGHTAQWACIPAHGLGGHVAPPRALTAMSRMAVTMLGAHRVTSQLAVTTPSTCSDVMDGGEHTYVPSTQYTPVVSPLSRT